MASQNFFCQILIFKKSFDFRRILINNRNVFEMKFLKFRKESNNFLLDVIFGQALGVGVNYVTSVSASEHIDQLKGQLVWLNSCPRV